MTTLRWLHFLGVRVEWWVPLQGLAFCRCLPWNDCLISNRVKVIWLRWASPYPGSLMLPQTEIHWGLRSGAGWEQRAGLMGPTYVCRCSPAHMCRTITGVGVRTENPVTLVLYCIVCFSLFLPLHAPGVEEGLEPQPGWAGKSTNKSLHSCLTLCRKQFPPIPCGCTAVCGNSEGELDRLNGSRKL